MDERLTITSDFHTHTTYSHGTGSVADNAKEALAKGLNALAITDHGFRHPLVGVGRSKFDAIRRDIETCSQETGLDIRMGIEANIVGLNGDIDLSASDISRLDVVLAGFHLTSFPYRISDYFTLIANGLTGTIKIPSNRGQIRRNTLAYVRAIERYEIDIVTHPGFRLDLDYRTIGKACADHGTLVEISSRHRTPRSDVMEDLMASGAQFVVNSDAHKPRNVGTWEYALALLQECGVPHERIANADGKKPAFRSRRNLTEV